MINRENLERVKEYIKQGKEVEKAGGIRVEIAQSDKIGYDFKNHYVNGVLVKQEYVEQEIKVGTPDNPIIWKEGMNPLENAYYIKDGVRTVYMAGEFIEF